MTNARYHQKHKEAIKIKSRQHQAEKAEAMSDEEKAERARAKAERAERKAQRAKDRVERAEQKRRLAEQKAAIDSERVARLAEKKQSTSDRVQLPRQIAKQERLEVWKPKGEPYLSTVCGRADLVVEVAQYGQLSLESERTVSHLEQVVKTYLASSETYDQDARL